jgi:hypothetical protein
MSLVVIRGAEQALVVETGMIIASVSGFSFSCLRPLEKGQHGQHR